MVLYYFLCSFYQDGTKNGDYDFGMRDSLIILQVNKLFSQILESIDRTYGYQTTHTSSSIEHTTDDTDENET